MDIDLLRYIAAQYDIAATRFIAAAEQARHTERRAHWNTAIILAIFGGWCLCLGIAVAGMLLRRG